MSSLSQMTQNLISDWGIVQTAQDKKRDDVFFSELVTFISRHFIDDRIANPDLKEIYLVRMNVLL